MEVGETKVLGNGPRKTECPGSLKLCEQSSNFTYPESHGIP